MKTIHDSHYVRLIERIKVRRMALRLSQVSLAGRLGVTNRWVSKVERRDIRLDVMTFVRVCSALGVRASRLIQKVEEELDDSGSSFYLLRPSAVWDKVPQ
jgi:transcriptional regulator with XRE-family HTH domain